MLPRLPQKPRDSSTRSPQKPPSPSSDQLSKLIQLQQTQLMKSEQQSNIANANMQRLTQILVNWHSDFMRFGKAIEQRQETAQGQIGRLLKFQSKGMKVGAEIAEKLGSLGESKGNGQVGQEVGDGGRGEEEGVSVVSHRSRTHQRLGFSQQFQITMVPVIISTPAVDKPQQNQTSQTVETDRSQPQIPSVGQISDKQIVVKASKYIKLPQGNFSIEDIRSGLAKWVTISTDLITKQAFHGYSSNILSESQAKVFFSKNLLLNFHELIRFIGEEIWSRHSGQILSAYNMLLLNALDFQLSNYPQKKKIFIGDELINLLPAIDRSKQARFNIVSNCGIDFMFKGEDLENYYSSIKTFLNKIVIEAKEHLPNFTKTVMDLFTIKGDQQQQSYQLEHLIGMKFRQNTPIYSAAEIEQDSLQIKTPEMLRVIVKWTEELEESFKNPTKWLDRQFANSQGRIIEVPPILISTFSRNLRTGEDYEKQASKSNDLAISGICQQINSFIKAYAQDFQCITESARSIGLTVYAFNQIVSDTLGRHLNSLITLLKIQIIMAYDQPHIKKLNLSPEDAFEIITFSVSDLLRAKCEGKFSDIQKVIAKMKKLQESGEISIARIKNRLNTGNRDFLVNFRLKGCAILCQLQIGLKTGKSDAKAVMLDHYNHFIYELCRAKYGPLAQGALIVANGTDLESFFQKRLPKIGRKCTTTSKIAKIIREKRLKQEGFASENRGVLTFICCNCNYIIKNLTYQASTDVKGNRYLCKDCEFECLNIQDQAGFVFPAHVANFFITISKQEIKKSKSLYFLILTNWHEIKVITNLFLKDYYYEAFLSEKTQPAFYKNFDSFKNSKFFTLKKQCKILKLNKDKIKEQQTKRRGTIILRNCGADLSSIEDTFLDKEYTFYPGFLKSQATMVNCLFLPEVKYILEIDKMQQQSAIRQIYKDYSFKLQFASLAKQKAWNLKKKQLNADPFQKYSKLNNTVVELYLSSNQFTDLSFFTSDSLKTLEMDYCGLESIKGCENFPKLQILRISSNKIQSLQGFQKCNNLTELTALRNKIMEFTLNGCHSLKQINLNDNGLLKFIAGNGEWAQLKTLKLEGNSLSVFDLSNVDMPALEILYINKNKLEKVLFPLLPRLKTLIIQQNPTLTELSIANTPNIEMVKAQKCSIQKLHFGKQHKLLCQLHFQKNAVQELLFQGINLARIYKVNFNNNLIKRVTFDPSMVRLRQLDLGHNRIREFSLKPLGNISQLTRIYISYNYISTIQFSEDADPARLQNIHFATNVTLLPKSNIRIPKKKVPNLSSITTERGYWAYGFWRWILQSYPPEKLEAFMQWVATQTETISRQKINEIFKQNRSDNGVGRDQQSYTFCQLMQAYTKYKNNFVFNKNAYEPLDRKNFSNEQEDAFSYKEENVDLSECMGWAN